MSQNQDDTDKEDDINPITYVNPITGSVRFLTKEEREQTEEKLIDKVDKYTTIPIIKNFLSENKLPQGTSKIKKRDLIKLLFSLNEDENIEKDKRKNVNNFIKNRLKGKEKIQENNQDSDTETETEDSDTEKKATQDTATEDSTNKAIEESLKGKDSAKASTSSPTKGSTSSPTETEDTPTETEEVLSSARSNAKTTKNNNNNVYQNIYVITNSEAERKQALEILSKRKKTEKQQKFLNMLGRRLGGGGGGGGTPKPKRGQKERRPLVKLKVNKVNEPLPKMIFPSTTIVLAKKFSGKTNLLLNIVDKSQFDNIWIVSLTGFTGKLDSLCEDSDCLLEDVSDTMINELLKLHKEDRMNSLIVFDDVIGQVDMRSKGMQKLATMGRNFGISIIISAQDFFKVPPIWRRNSEYWYIGNLTDSNIEAVAKELSVPSFQKKRIRQELGEIARDKNHDWLYYDDRKTRFRKLFGTQFKIIV